MTGLVICPFSFFSAEKPHVFRKATCLVAFRNTCGFWRQLIDTRPQEFKEYIPPTRTQPDKFSLTPG